MREITVITVLCLLTVCNVFAAGAEVTASPARLFIEGGTLLDGTGAQPGENPGILVEGERIHSIGAAATDGHDVERISAEGMWILPGLFDLHVHVTLHAARPPAPG